MSLISVIGDAEATGHSKEIYEGLKERHSKISNIMKVQSLNPQAMKEHAPFLFIG